ncbi:MAG: recombination mediator RecR [candidate division WOR-3 bacterium]|nr:recombination mediator RecR [candidate division WOR-3 bacterium]MCX7837161.1 recombination mediator RecR [candidate division WOR-3 bacterium]MDW8114184.1 recombination mediator RecR [candidate division WOR-3 bacterium]
MNEDFKKILKFLEKLPGIGKRSAQRIGFYLLKMDENEIKEFTNSLILARESLKICEECFNYSEERICKVCRNENRDNSLLCIVEEPSHLFFIESSKVYNGKYFVLGGLLTSEKEEIMKERINKLLEKVKKNELKEIIIALNPTTEGEATSYYLYDILKEYNKKITRIGLGLPFGSSLELTDPITITKAMEGRKEIS